MDDLGDRDGRNAARTFGNGAASASDSSRWDDVARDPDPTGPDTALALTLLREITASAYLMDPDGRITQVNPVGLAQLGVAHNADANGRYLWDLWPNAAEASLTEALADAVEGEAAELSVRCPVEGGRLADCRVRLLPIEDSEGSVSKILAIARQV